MRRLLIRLAPPAFLLFLLSACSTIPEETEKARGVLTGVNLVLALSVLFVVAAVGIIGAVLVIDRAVRTRGELAEGMPVAEEEEPEDEVVAGIGVGRAPVPRWLYAAYVLIPLFAFAYVFSNIAPEPSAEEATPKPTPSGPCTECEIAAAQIKFDKEVLEVAAATDITVTFNNNDSGVPHDFTVWDGAEAGKGKEVTATGTVAGGASKDAKFTSPAAGETWAFNCTIHPASMFGTIEPAAG
jgi:hypothetical protein